MGKLDVHISHGSDHGWLVPVIVVGGLAVMAGGGLSGAASSVTSALIWAAVVAGITVLAMAVALVVLMRRSGFKMAHVGDPKTTMSAIEAEKRAELAKIRAMRLQIEAARIAGVEITPDMLRVAEDPELADLVMRFRAAANRFPAVESGPRA